MRYALLLLICVFSPCSLAEEPNLEKVTDNVYRFVSGNYRSLVIRMPDGITVIDPLNQKSAETLSRLISAKFTLPVTRVIYSHSHPDHVYGTRAFQGSNPAVIAHEQARSNLLRTKADTVLPDTTFSDHLSIINGGQRIELTYLGPNNGYGNITIGIYPDDVMFVADWVVLGRMPYKDLKGYDIQGMLDSTDKLLAMPFSTFVGGHAEMGDRAGVSAYREYIVALHDGVLGGILNGQSLPEIQKSLTLDAFSHLSQFKAWRALNIEGVYNQLNRQSYLDMPPREG